jgi:hypothetical protein
VSEKDAERGLGTEIGNVKKYQGRQKGSSNING